MFRIYHKGQFHSEFNTWEEAQEQAQILRDSGYRHIKVEYSDYDNDFDGELYL
jgi:hypothetical protein